MRGELIALHRRLGATMIYVTHDQVEAMTMADRIVVLQRRRRSSRPARRSSSTPSRATPSSPRFLGAPPMNLLQGTARAPRRRARRRASTTAITSASPAATSRPPDGTPVSVGIRPEHAEPGPGALEVTVGTTEMLGSETMVHAVTRSGDSFTYSRRGISRAVPGDRLRIDFPEPFVHLFDASGLTIGARPDWRDAYLT